MGVLVCVSYCSVQKETVRAICEYLSSRKVFTNIHVDLRQRSVGDSNVQDLEKNMAVTEFAILVASDDYRTSKVCEREAHSIVAAGKPIFLIRLYPYSEEYKLPCGKLAAEQFDFNVTPDQPFEVMAEKLATALKRFLAYLVIPKSHQAVSLTLKIVNVPKFIGVPYYKIESEERDLLESLENLHVRPLFETQRLIKFLFICGVSGVGKTYLLSQIIHSYPQFLHGQCGFFNTVIWVDCCKWNKTAVFDEDDFAQQISSLMPSISVNVEESTEQKGVVYNDSRRMLFILDGVNNAHIVECFYENWPELPCVVLTHEVDMLTKVHRQFNLQNVCSFFYLSTLDEKNVVKQLETTFKLCGKLESSQLANVAKLARGLPLGLNIIGARFSSRLKDNAIPHPIKIYEELMSEVAHCVTITSNPLGNLVDYCLNVEDASFRKLFYAFLLFEPGEAVHLEDLAILWKTKSLHQTSARSQQFVFKSLVQHAINGPNPEDELVYKVHPLVHEAAVRNAIEARRFANSLSQLRFRIAIGNCCLGAVRGGSVLRCGDLLVVAFYRRRWSLLEAIVTKLDEPDLFDLCRQSSYFTKGKSMLNYFYTSIATGPTAHFTEDDCRKAIVIIEKAISRFTRSDLEDFLACEGGGSLLADYLQEKKQIRVLELGVGETC